MKWLRPIVTAIVAAFLFVWSGQAEPNGGLHGHPNAPAQLVASGVSASQIRLVWLDDTHNELGFKIERAPDAGGAPGTWSQIATVGANVVGFNDTGGAANRKYWYRVRAHLRGTDSDYSNLAGARTFPLPPAYLTATAAATNRINLSWTPEANGETGFKIERAPDTGGIPGTWSQIATVGATNQFSDTGLAPGTAYWYRVRAYNSTGDSAFANEAGATTLFPPCPTSLSQWGYTYGTFPAGLTGVVAIAAGYTHSLALISDGTVVGWGQNYYGEAKPPTNLTGVLAIAAGRYHSLALKNDGTVVEWGYDYYGSFDPPTNLTGVVAIATGDFGSVALKSDGTVVDWGFNYYGWPTIPTNLTDVVAIAAGGYHALALKSDGTVVGWAYQSYFNVTPPTNLTGVVAIAAGGYHGLALKNDGTVVGWRNGGFSDPGTPPTNLTGVVAIAAGFSHSLALRNDGTIVGWGANYYNQATPLGLTGGATAIAAGGSFSLALTVAPSPPSLRREVIAATNQVDLYWVDNSTTEDGFRIERALDDGNNNLSWTPIGTANADSTSFSDVSVTPNMTYRYRVQSFNRCGTSPFSAPGAISVVAPTPPYYLNANIGATNLVNLSWYDSSGIATGFRLERAPDVAGNPGTWTEIATVSSTNSNYYSHSDPGVSANSTNWYRVLAFNVIGDSPYSDPAIIRVVVPEPPNLSASTFRDQVSVNWSGNSGGIMGFQLERAPDVSGSPGPWTEIATFDPTDTTAGSYLDTGRAVNTTYWYRVRAFNWVGYSPYSNPVSATVLPPATPSDLTASIWIPNQVDLSWNDYTADQDGFKVERALDAGGIPGPWQEIATLSISNNSYTSYTDTNALANTTNWYRVRAFNLFGDSPYSSPVSIYLVPPAAPELSASAFRDQLNLNWTDASGGLMGFKLERAPDVAGSPGAWTEIAVFDFANISSGAFTDFGRAADTTYWYRVRAYNWIGDSPYSVPVNATIVPPGAPTSLQATIGTTNQVNLFWQDTYWDEDGFVLERAPDTAGNPGAWTEIATAGPGYYNYFTDTNLVANTTNWYRVRAFNLVGVSAYSDPISIRLLPPDAPYLSAGANRDQVDLNWNDYSGGVMGFKLERAADVAGNPGAWTEIAMFDPANTSSGSFIDTGRAADTTYWYRVRAFNWTGDSLYSAPVSATIVPPGTPNWLQATIGNTNEVNLYWYDGYGDQDGFKLERALDSEGNPGTWSEIAIFAPGYNNYVTDTNVTANTTNWYRVRAFNVVGNSAYSDALSIRVMPPDAPAYLLANVFRDQISLNWSDYSGGVMGFKLERAPDTAGNPGAWAIIAVFDPANTSSGSYLDTGRAANTTYWYRVRAYNWAGYSSYSDTVSATIVPPVTPNSLQAAIGITNQVNLSWQDGYGDEDGFTLERAPDASGSPGTWSEIASLPPNYYSYYSDTNVMGNTTNWYRVRAFNVVGNSAYIDPASIRVVPPDAPAYLSASAFRDQISVYWSDNSGGVMGFKLERAPDVAGSPGAWTEIAAFDPANTAYGSYTDTGRAANTTYWYRVRAFNWVGDSPYSEPLSVTIVPPGVPNYLRAVIGTTNQVNLFWNDSYGDEDGFKVERAPEIGGSSGEWTEIGSIDATNYYNNFTDTNALANTTNWYRVRAFNWIGNSAYSSPARIRIVPPDAPFYLTANAFRDQVNLFWYGNYYYGGPVGFKLERAPDAGGNPDAWTEIAVLSPAGTSYGFYTDTGRAADTTYWYRVRASNWVGDSPYTYSASVTIVPPVAPSSLSANLGTTNQVDLWWYDYAADEDGFKLEWSPDAGGSPGLWTEIATLNATNANFGSYSDTNVLANTTNWYRVRAFNAEGISAYSAPASVKVVPPDAPVNLAANASSAHSVNVYWFYTSSGVGGCRIERAPDTDGSPGTWTEILASSDTDYNYYMDSGVTTNHTYWYRVRAYNWVGISPYSSPVSVVVAPPAAPSGLTAAIVAPNQVGLRWIGNTPGEYGFKLERAPDLAGSPGTWEQVASIDAYYTNYTDSGVVTGRPYWYRVRAYNACGDSPYSPTVSIDTTVRISFDATRTLRIADSQWLVFQLSGQTGVRCVVQTSTDLAQWTPVSTNILSDSALNCTNMVTPGLSEEFWRAVWQP